MEFRFDANQDYQLQAIAAVTGLLEGQPRIEVDLSFGPGSGFAAVPNRLDLGEPALLANLQAVQRQNAIRPDDGLKYIEESIKTAAGEKDVCFPNFSVEMETGTGKTYVYLRTALDLFRRYGLRKFIVVVPSVAVREGVLKTLQVTEAHLKDLYGNVAYHYAAYASANLSQVRRFALSDGVEFLVMTIDSFNKASNVMLRTTDRLQGDTPIHLVQATRPVLILDEPQNMESEQRVRALAALDPLFALRYSATHRNPYNVVYRLTPFAAYRQGLVKRIEVDSVVQTDDANRPFVRLESIKTQRTRITARIRLHKLMASGRVREGTVTVRPGDSLREKSGRREYDGFEIDEINPGGRFVRFANNIELEVGEERGTDKEAIFEAQIRDTIEQHFRKQQRLKDRGLKVLSLFFIDQVDNYASEDGLIRRLFDQAFDDLKTGYPEWADRQPAEVQAAYFAQRRRKGGTVRLMDSSTGETQRDEQAYNLIMKDKERLLSFDEPTAFIFSHSALREGWDSPNVFQICTLNQTLSEMRKRQEVGRGVRLAVDQAGERVHDEQVNVLTVVANESYERYVATLQSEIASEYRDEIEARYGKSIGDLTDEERQAIEAEWGRGILPPPPADARKRGVARLRKCYTLRPEFQELWERIKHKTRYAVRVDTERLLEDTVAELDQSEIRPPRVTVTRAQVEVDADGALQALQTSAARTVVDLAGRYPLPDLIGIMTNLLAQTTPPVRLGQRTLLEVFRRTSNKQAAMDNPHEFATVAVQTIKSKLADQLVSGIRYEKINDWYEMTQFDTEISAWQQYLVPSRKSDGSEGSSLYDHVPYDYGVEKSFVEALEARHDVRLYLKLPRWFTVPTPVGSYNPDWAIVMENEAAGPGAPLLYLVRETKSTTMPDELRPNEERKVRCGKRHFREALGVDFKVATSAAELP